MKRGKSGGFVSDFALTVIVGIPLALAAIIWGGQALIWLLEFLPKDY